MTAISRSKTLGQIYLQNKIDPKFQKARNDFLKRLEEDPDYRKIIEGKRAFGQARRRAREKGVTLPKVTWLDRPDISLTP
jgi:hypothetical protein